MGARTPLVLVLAVLAALAAGAFLYLRAGADDPAPRGAVAAARTGAEPAAPAPTAALVEPEGAAAPTQREAAPPVASGREPTPAPAREARATGRRFVGRVVDELGNGLGGAVVYASNRSGFALDWAGEAPFPWLERTVARTEADGRFELAGLSAGNLSLAVRMSGFAPYDKRGLTVPPGEADHELDPVVLVPGAILSGRVVDAGGRGVPDASLLRRGSDTMGFFIDAGSGRGSLLAKTDANGAFRVDTLACGPYEIEVNSEEHPAKVFRGLAEVPGREVAGLEFRLDAADAIEGQVVGIPEEERGELEVRATLAPEGGGFDFDFWSAARVVKADDHGRFLVKGLRAGEDYELQARRQRAPDDESFFFGGSRSTRVRASAGDTGVVITYQPESTISFQVVDAETKEPLTDFRVEAGIGFPRPLTGRDGKPLLEHPDGVVVVDGLRPSSVHDRARVSVRAVGYRDFERDDVQMSPGLETSLGRIHLEPIPVVRVTVVDAKTGQPISGARVRLEEEQPESGPGRRYVVEDIEADDGGDHPLPMGGGESARTDDEGVAVLSSKEGQSVTVHVNAQGYAPLERPGLFLPAGAVVEDRVELTRGGRVVVTVLDADGNPAAGRRVGHKTPDELASDTRMMVFGGAPTRNVTDSEGVVAFDNLPPGEHGFRLEEGAGGDGVFFGGGGEARVAIAGLGGSGDDGWERVEVLEGETSTLTLQAAPRGRVTGRVREAGKALAGATVRLSSDDGPPGLPGGFDPFGSSGPKARTDGEGRYVLDDVEVGDYSIVFEHPTRRMESSYPLEVEVGENDFDVDLPVSVIEGRVTDEENKPVEGLTVTVERASNDGPRVSMNFVMVADDGDSPVVSVGDGLEETVRTDADGRYRLRGVLPDEELVVQVQGGSFQPARSEPVRLHADEVRSDVDVRVERGGSILVVAQRADGSPARLCLVQARYGDEAAGLAPKTGVLQTGQTTLEGLKPGAWRVSVRPIGPGSVGQQPDDEHEVQVRAGESVEESFVVD